MIATSDQRDIAAAEDSAHRLAVLSSRSEDVLALLVIDADGDGFAIELPTSAPQMRKETRFARVFRRVTGS